MFCVHSAHCVLRIHNARWSSKKNGKNSGSSALPQAQIINTTTTILSTHFNANIGEFPYMVSFQKRFDETSERGHQCGGVLITLEHVLTAASCLFFDASGYPAEIDSKYYRIFAGHNGLSNDKDPDRLRLIKSYTMHPNFEAGDKHLYDIAVLTLASPFIENYRLKPLPLPKQDDRPENHLYDDRVGAVYCKVPGWGQDTPTAPTQNTMKYVSKTLRNLKECESEYPKVDLSAVSSSMVCAASTMNMTYGCHGDEGNPLVCNNRLVGILFQNHTCEISTKPQLYTRVSHYSNWIQSVIDAQKASSTTFQPTVAMVTIFTVSQYVISKFNI
ncbi:kallikrein-6-like isoform X1 [Trichoplusia ni]|uniref:Kallikrein-6-like isoform X1 n=1 Tax=Trichoplusia ni TaxID=7111 RepID=A0A7E5W926_TRINI|nr:kallikrein-6-like isoform X1 [Trichoplusia ni]